MLDLTSVGFMDSMGLRVIMTAWNRLAGSWAHGHRGRLSDDRTNPCDWSTPARRIPIYTDPATAILALNAD